MKITPPTISLCALLACLPQAHGFAPTATKFLPLVAETKLQPSRSELEYPPSSSRRIPSFPTRTTRLSMSANNNEADKKTTSGPPVVLNVGLVAQLVLNQAIVGSTIWAGGPGYQTLQKSADFFNGNPVALGVAGAAALVGFSRLVETSESPLVSGLNLSTEMVVLRLFGPNRQPLVAFVVAASMAGLTGLVEETTFRGQALPFLTRWSQTTLGLASGDVSLVVGAALTTLLFAVLHTNPLSLFKGGDAAKDNAVLLVFQLVTGSIFMTLFLTTHNLAVPIIAHALYDFYTFFNTHLQVTGQMEYAKTESRLPSASFLEETKWKTARGESFIQEARQTFYLMDTNQDGVLSRKELRIALASYGINLSKLESEKVLRVADLDQDGSISFDEFLEFVGPSGSPGKAVKSSLLGPV